MPQPNRIYRPLYSKPWFGTGRVRAWSSDDHLLIVENRSFTEHYTRLYWADIQTVLLYGLASRAVLLTILEVACALAAVIPLVMWRIPWIFVPAVLFAACYATWRFSRPRWACQVTSKINSKRFAIPGTLVACRRVLNGLKNFAASAQGMGSEDTIMALPNGLPVTQMPSSRAGRREPKLTVHVIAFVLGLLSSFNGVFFVFYCIALTIAYFMQRDFEFPIAVRSAAVMSQIFAVLQVAFWAFASTRFSFLTRFPFDHWQFGLPRVLMSLYGIVAVYWVSMERAKPRQKTSTVLGLS